jgi:hypothetical protein
MVGERGKKRDFGRLRLKFRIILNRNVEESM